MDKNKEISDVDLELISNEIYLCDTQFLVEIYYYFETHN